MKALDAKGHVMQWYPATVDNGLDPYQLKLCARIRK